ncbi:ANM_collapsed_G0058390.mRNA.1.CDS.1 [Saccharomyces cerevisiae]|nr:ANM_collapsed_G0058390.mRNA.1.CDS.1 [Saccharomyces cerevisiae]
MVGFLASPMRAEKISKLKSCRELLIPLKVVPSTGKDQHADKDKLKLVPTLDYSKSYKKLVRIEFSLHCTRQLGGCDVMVPNLGIANINSKEPRS